MIAWVLRGIVMMVVGRVVGSWLSGDDKKKREQQRRASRAA